jgi:hypothetical protein
MNRDGLGHTLFSRSSLRAGRRHYNVEPREPHATVLSLLDYNMLPLRIA